MGYLKKRENIFGTYNDWFANKDKFDYGTGGCKGRSEQCAKYLNVSGGGVGMVVFMVELDETWVVLWLWVK